MSAFKEMVQDWKSAMVSILHAIRVHPWWSALLVGIDLVFFMGYFPLFHSTIMQKLQEIGFATVLLIQSNIATLGLLDIFILPGFRNNLLIFLAILCVLIVVFYVLFTFYSLAKWNVASKILGFKPISIKQMFIINAWWMLLLVGLRTVYFIVQVPFTLGRWDFFITILEFVVLLLMAKLWYWTLISYACASKVDKGVVSHSIRLGSSKRSLIVFGVLILLAVLGNYIVSIFGVLSLFMPPVTIVVVVITILYLLWLYLLIIKVIYSEVIQ